jgi:hypothetical protein
MKSGISSVSTKKELSKFFEVNQFTCSQSQLIEQLIEEAKLNRFTVKIHYSK